ncbi:MAG: GNAT family N-acetyltransferase [Acidobacteriota bacterium]|nr:GNAT family N-acetyltransferase [Acidobacteriota bacterium]
MHHILSMDFHPVEENLRTSFRALAAARVQGGVVELPGVTIASLGARFQMFNAAFLSAPTSQDDFEERLSGAREYFGTRDLAWAFWICEDWLDYPLRRKLSSLCSRYGLRLSSEMPGMIADAIRQQRRILPELEIRPLDAERVLNDFRGVGSVCFHVPLDWFSEVFDERMASERTAFRCWVGYVKGLPVATAAAIASDGVVGLYNIATAPGHRGRGIAEAITRHAVTESFAALGERPVVLQSTSRGLPLYERLGFRPVTRILVYVSK